MHPRSVVPRCWTLARWLTVSLVTMLVLAVSGTAPVGAASLGTGLDNSLGTGLDDQPTADLTTAGIDRSHTVFLLSGDEVHYTEHADGSTTVAVHAADRADDVPVAFETVDTAEGYFVIPTDAAPRLADGTLDRQLFNVTTLVSEGLANADQLPVIISEAAGISVLSSDPRRLEALPASSQIAMLSSLNGMALQVDRSDAETLWAAITADPGMESAVADGTRIWLDRAVTVALDESVPQVGAPQMWDAGYDGSGVTVAVLDTGIDPQHPDLADRIVGTANFTGDPFTDGHGHGTHVASIVAGSGEAADGMYRGVAPGAELLVGKAIPDSGTGPMSAVIAGMEWAADQGADIVNLSVAGPTTDGTDPASLALEALSAATDTLFVVATGNDSSDAQVGAPAVADSALAVGAVDKQDQLAGYSNRGPRLGDAGVKPELTAPGTGIAAARAAGTSLGTPVNEHYTRANGTSMAAPHVAGAAALLAQANPDWSWEELKDALVSTAAPGDYTSFQGGAGRLDIAGAFNSRVYGPASVNLGALPAPYQEQRSEQLTYRNDTDQPVTLELSLTGRSWHGQDLPPGAVTLDRSSVTVPAHGTAAVTLTVDAAPGDVGAYTGVVTARSDTISLRSPFGYYKSVGSHELTVTNLDYRGQPDGGRTIYAIKLDGALPNDPFHQMETSAWSDDNGQVRLRVAEGVYDIYGSTVTWDVDADRITTMAETELTIAEDTAVTLDGRNGVLVDPFLPERTDLKANSVNYVRGFPGGEFGTGYLIQYSRTQRYMQPAEVSSGWLEVRKHWLLASSLLQTVEVRTAGVTAPLAPDYHSFYAAPALAGEHDLEVVYAGTGTPEELAAAEVDGRMALVRIPIPPGVSKRATHAWQEAGDITDAAQAAGAAGVLFYVDVPDAIAIGMLRSQSILQLSVPWEEGEQLRQLLEDPDVAPARLMMTGVQHPERLYHLRYLHEDPSLPEPREQVDVDDLVAVSSRYHSDEPDYVQRMFSYGFTPREQTGGGLTPNFWAPFEVTEYIVPGTHLRWHRQVTQAGANGNDRAEPMSSREQFLPGEVRPPEIWFQSPMVTGAADVPLEHQWRDEVCTNCRHGDQFRPGYYYLDTDRRHYERSYLDFTSYRMFHNGEEIPNQGSIWAPSFPMRPEPAIYRLEMESTQPGVPRARTLAPRVVTAWTFPSSRPADGAKPEGYRCPVTDLDAGCAFQPLLQLDYQLELDLLNRAPAGQAHQFQVGVAPHSGTGLRLGPAFPQLELAYSTDGGASWTEATVQPDRDAGVFLVTVEHPPLADTDGYVWLRVNAWEWDGNRVEQTIERAYALH
jgi:subtilisin family serine protease